MLTAAAFLALSAEERATHLAGLTGEELAALRADLEAHFATLDEAGDLSDDGLAAMEACAEARSVVLEAENAYTAEVAERETRAAALREQMASPAETPPGETGIETPEGGAPDPATAGDPADAPAQPGGTPTPEATPETPAPEAVAAAAGTPGTPPAAPARRSPIGAMGARRPATATPRPNPPARVIPLRAQDGIPGFRAGQELDMRALGQAVTEALRTTDGAPGRVPIARLDWSASFSEDRTLRRGQTVDNDRKIEALTNLEAMTAAAEAYFATDPSDTDALTAAGGGFCAPFPVDYAVPVEGTVTRPARDALARFGAERGGIRFTPPPELMSAEDAGIGTWTADDDAGVSVDLDGTYTSAKVKPIVEFDCLDDTEEQVAAITFRASFSNFNARFAPEQVAAHQRLALVAAARFADMAVMAGLWARSDYRVTTPVVLGAVRDWFAAVDQLLPQIRYRRRLARTFPMRVMAPESILDLFRADFVRQMPTDDLDTAMALADATLLRWARARNVNLSFTQESRSDAAGLARVQPTLAADGTGTAALLDFADVWEWFAFPEGSVQFLDGGTLDLGIVRDTRTNAVNRYETFVETFEGIAKRGTPLYAVRSTLQPTGTASGLTDIHTSDL